MSLYISLQCLPSLTSITKARQMPGQGLEYSLVLLYFSGHSPSSKAMDKCLKT